jgi:hypothetical protein
VPSSRKAPYSLSSHNQGEYAIFAGLEDCLRFVAHFKFSDDGECETLLSVAPRTQMLNDHIPHPDRD